MSIARKVKPRKRTVSVAGESQSENRVVTRRIVTMMYVRIDTVGRIAIPRSMRARLCALQRGTGWNFRSNGTASSRGRHTSGPQCRRSTGSGFTAQASLWVAMSPKPLYESYGTRGDLALAVESRRNDKRPRIAGRFGSSLHSPSALYKLRDGHAPTAFWRIIESG